MKVDIKSLQLALLNGGIHVLDLDTGMPISYQMIAEHRTCKPKRFVRIPWESSVPVYQAYVKKVFAEIPSLIDTYNLLSYPEYEEAIASHAYFDEYEYIDKAHNFFENVVTGLIYSNRRNGQMKINPDFPTFDEYQSFYMLQYAKDWCSAEGYEWFEN